MVNRGSRSEQLEEMRSRRILQFQSQIEFADLDMGLARVETKMSPSF